MVDAIVTVFFSILDCAGKMYLSECAHTTSRYPQQVKSSVEMCYIQGLACLLEFVSVCLSSAEGRGFEIQSVYRGVYW